MLLVSHEMSFVRNVATRVIFLDGGKILEDGTPREVFGNPNERTCQRVLYKDQPDGRTGLFNLREKTKRLRDQSIFSNRIKEGSERNEYQTRAGKTESDSVGKGKDYERKYIDRMGK